MLTKEEVLQAFQTLPDKFDVNEAHEQLELLEGIRVGIEQAGNGQTISLEPMEARIASWRAKRLASKHPPTSEKLRLI